MILPRRVLTEEQLAAHREAAANYEAKRQLDSAVRDMEGADDACLVTLTLGAVRSLKAMLEPR